MVGGGGVVGERGGWVGAVVVAGGGMAEVVGMGREEMVANITDYLAGQLSGRTK